MNASADTATLALRLLEIYDARRALINTSALKTLYLTTLHRIVGLRVPHLSYYDLLDAEPQEHAEALRRTVGWEAGL